MKKYQRCDDLSQEACAKTWTMDWTMDAGRWTMDDGRWTMDAGRWTLDDGRWTMDVAFVLKPGRWTIFQQIQSPAITLSLYQALKYPVLQGRLTKCPMTLSLGRTYVR